MGMTDLFFIEDRLASNSKHGMIWHKRKPKLFTEYETTPYMKVKVGRKWEFIPMGDIDKFPSESVMSPFQGEI